MSLKGLTDDVDPFILSTHLEEMTMFPATESISNALWGKFDAWSYSSLTQSKHAKARRLRSYYRNQRKKK